MAAKQDWKSKDKPEAEEKPSATVAETMAKARTRIAHFQRILEKLTTAVQSGNEHAVKDALAATPEETPEAEGEASTAS